MSSSQSGSPWPSVPARASSSSLHARYVIGIIPLSLLVSASVMSFLRVIAWTGIFILGSCWDSALGDLLVPVKAHILFVYAGGVYCLSSTLSGSPSQALASIDLLLVLYMFLGIFCVCSSVFSFVSLLFCLFFGFNSSRLRSLCLLH